MPVIGIFQSLKKMNELWKNDRLNYIQSGESIENYLANKCIPKSIWENTYTKINSIARYLTIHSFIQSIYNTPHTRKKCCHWQSDTGTDCKCLLQLFLHSSNDQRFWSEANIVDWWAVETYFWSNISKYTPH